MVSVAKGIEAGHGLLLFGGQLLGFSLLLLTSSTASCLYAFRFVLLCSSFPSFSCWISLVLLLAYVCHFTIPCFLLCCMLMLPWFRFDFIAIRLIVNCYSFFATSCFLTFPYRVPGLRNYFLGFGPSVRVSWHVGTRVHGIGLQD